MKIDRDRTREVPEHDREGNVPCQLLGMIRSAPPAGAEEDGKRSFFVRAKIALKRRLGVRAHKKLKGFISGFLDLFDHCHVAMDPVQDCASLNYTKPIGAGDLVRVKPRQEIEATLDRWRSLKGCGFLEEMASYCGTTQRVLKRVERFIDERDYRLKKVSGIVLLEGVMCSGIGGTGRCDRACFFFWREEWLDKIDGSA